MFCIQKWLTEGYPGHTTETVAKKGLRQTESQNYEIWIKVLDDL